MYRIAYRLLNTAAIGCCALTLSLAACSNDVDLPNDFHEHRLGQPDAVEASVGGSTVTVTWQLASLQNAVGFVVRFTNADGAEETRIVQDASARSLEDNTISLAPGNVYLVDVWAIDEFDFYGPASIADSLVIEEK